MKLRIEGNLWEIKLAERIIQAGLQSQGGQIKSISKFYPNTNTAERMLNRESKEGRVYIEIN